MLDHEKNKNSEKDIEQIELIAIVGWAFVAVLLILIYFSR